MSENKVNEIKFWKTRIEAAKMTGVFNHSVYDTGTAEFQAIWRTHQKIIEKIIPKEATILDLGCGYGRACTTFSPENYTGADFSPDFIELAKRDYPNYKFVVENIKKLSFADKQFDWVLLLSIRQMIRRYQSEEEWLEYEKEIKRVGKKVLILEYTDPEIYEIYG